MYSLGEAIEFEWVVFQDYGTGLIVMLPPFAGGGAVAGWWLNRPYALGPRLAGSLLGATGGAWIGFWWVYAGGTATTPVEHLLITVTGLVLPYLQIATFGFVGLIAAFLDHSPLLLASILYIAARRHEDAFDEWVNRLRERIAEHRQARAEQQALLPAVAEPLSMSAMTVSEPAPVPAVRETAMTAEPIVLQAVADRPVPFPAGLVVDEENRLRPIYIVVQAPAQQSPVFVGRGRVANFFFGTYYVFATVTKLWLPLALLTLWFFWAPLLGFVQRQLAGMIRHALPF